MSANQGKAIEVDGTSVQGGANLVGGLSSDEFRSAFGDYPAGVAVITADAGQGPVGLTATSLFSISSEPPILGFAVSDHSSSTPTIRRADTVVVHLLDGSLVHIAKLCATSGVDRFADTSIWSRLATGEPYFVRAPRWIRGRVVGRMRAGTSTVLAVHALEATLLARTTGPMVYHNRTWHKLSVDSVIPGD